MGFLIGRDRDDEDTVSHPISTGCPISPSSPEEILVHFANSMLALCGGQAVTSITLSKQAMGILKANLGSRYSGIIHTYYGAIKVIEDNEEDAD